MQDDLSELLARVEYCSQKSGFLDGEITRIAGQSIRHWLFPWRPGTGEIKAQLLAHPPVALRQEVGMLVNEQRAILDALCCKLAVRNGANDTSDVYFPITKTKAGFYEDIGKRKIRKLAPPDQETIEGLKPWRPSDNDPEDGNPVLFQLHEADRVRKHQNLLRWACVGGVYPASDGIIGHMQSGSVIFHDVGKEETLAFFSNVTCRLGVQFTLVYIEPDYLNGHAVAPLLSGFNRAVGEVVSRFA